MRGQGGGGPASDEENMHTREGHTGPRSPSVLWKEASNSHGERDMCEVLSDQTEKGALEVHSREAWSPVEHHGHV